MSQLEPMMAEENKKRKLPKHASPREINIPALHLHFNYYSTLTMS
jgi:hypothetical protein